MAIYCYEVCLRAHFKNNLVLRAGFRFNVRRLHWLTPERAKGALTRALLQECQGRGTHYPAQAGQKLILRQASGFEATDVDVAQFSAEIENAVKNMVPIWELKDVPSALTKTLSEVCPIYAKEIMVNHIRV